jgi:hypothetical protein
VQRTADGRIASPNHAKPTTIQATLSHILKILAFLYNPRIHADTAQYQGVATFKRIPDSNPMIVFSFRELKRAWRQAGTAFEDTQNKTNAHRLLLFYAVETGLKAVWLKRTEKQDSSNEFSKVKHDLNKLMDDLKVGATLRLDTDICLDQLSIQGKIHTRETDCGGLNQIWRYGAKAKSPTDEVLEKKLLDVQEWIKGELS